MPNLSPQEQLEFDQRIDELRQRHFLRAGLAGDLTVEKFVPATGIGKFDAVYTPQTNRLDINIHARFSFQDKVGTEADDSEVAWDELEKRKFVEEAIALGAGWSEQYVIACTRPGWLKFYANVFVNLLPAQRGAEDYVIQVRKIARPKSSGGINHGVVPHVCGVNNYANQLDESKKVEHIFNYKEGIFRAKIRESRSDKSGDFIEFSADSTDLQVDENIRLMQFANFINMNRPLEVRGIKAYCVGVTGKRDSVFSRNLSKNRTAAVAALLNGRVAGADFAEVASADEPWAKEAVRVLKARPRSPATGLGGVLIVIRTPSGVSRAVPYRYVVMKHEIGHMLGLPDEYMGVHSEHTVAKLRLDAVVPSTYYASTPTTGNDRLKKMQEGLVRDLIGADVNAPTFMATTGTGDAESGEFFGQKKEQWYAERKKWRQRLGDGKLYEAWKTRNPEPVAPTPLTTVSSSIMHSGHEILPAHYVTIWSALSRITHGYIDPDQWKIVPGKAEGSLRYFG